MSHRILRVVVLVVAAILPLQTAPAATAAASMPTIAAIAAGGFHTCALTSGGGVKCWGHNGYGQLGNGTRTNPFSPVDVSGLASGVVAITAGYYHTCALMSSGGIKCWGSNENGQLGNGPRDGGPHPDSLTPVDVLRADSLSPVETMSGVAAISAGGLHTCALTKIGRVNCWGWNASGQLGYGKMTDGIPWPVDVQDLGSGVTLIAAGPLHTCAVAAGGQVKCWGNNQAGQLGNRSTDSTSTPVDVSGLADDVTGLAMGFDHTCALTSGGGVKCWGANYSGQLGDGTTNPGFSPVDVLGLTSDVGTIAAGDSWAHACVLTSWGPVKCWGDNVHGQLGNGSTTDSSTPVDVSGLDRVADVAVGYYHSCALTDDGRVKCWGNNSAGGLGNGSTTDSNLPVDVVFASRQTTISLRTSMPAGTIARGTAVTFTAAVRPVSAAGTRATVRFTINHLVGGVWRQSTHRDVAASATGRATLRWTFSAAGSWYIRAKALENATYAASVWSPRSYYTVR